MPVSSITPLARFHPEPDTLRLLGIMRDLRSVYPTYLAEVLADWSLLAGAFGLVAVSESATGAVNAAVIQAAHDALPASGGVLWLPAGTFNVAGSISITKSVRICGVVAGTTLQQTTAAATTFSVACVTPVEFRDLTLNNTTGGTCIEVTGTASNNANGLSRFEHLTLAGGAYGLKFTRAALWTVYSCYVASTTTAGIFVQNDASAAQDDGDSNITSCIFDNTGAGISWAGSGGLRIINNKILSGTAGVLIAPSASVATSTILVVGNSIENNTYGVLMQGATNGTLSGVIITGNQFANTTNNVACVNANVSNVTVSNNLLVAAAAGTTAVLLNPVTQASVSGNTIIGQGGGGTGVGIGAAAVSVQVGTNNYINTTLPVTSANATAVINGMPAFLFANLPTCADGSVVYCSDGTIANPVAALGTGCIAKRLGGVWVGD